MSKSGTPSPTTTTTAPKAPNETEKAVKKSFGLIMLEIQNIHKLANNSSDSVRTSYRNKFKKAVNEELSQALDRLDGKTKDLF